VRFTRRKHVRFIVRIVRLVECGGGTQRRTFCVCVLESLLGLSLRRAISSGAKESDGGETRFEKF